MSKRIMALSLTGMVLASVAYAQVLPGGRRDARQPRGVDARAVEAPNQNMDSILATKLILGNQGEVAISKLAAEKASNEKVKQFANEMVKAHTQAIEDLKKFAGDEANWKLEGVEVTRSTETRTETRRDADAPRDANRDPNRDTNRDPNRNPDRPKDPNEKRSGPNNQNPADAQATPQNPRPNAPGGQRRDADDQRTRTTTQETTVTNVQGRGDHAQGNAIEREECQKCIELMKAELQQHQGADFDKAYIGQQIGGHIHMIAKLETFQRHASPELAQLTSKSLAMAQQHLQQAKDICNELKGEQRTERTERNPK